MPDQVFEQAYSMACRAARARLAAVVSMGALPRQDCEDWEQEALMAVWRALQRFDPSRASLRTFVEMVVAARFASLMRTRRCRPALEPLDDYQPVGLDGIPALEFRTDFQRVSASLAERDRGLAALLVDHSPTEASRALRLSRSTIYEGIGRIRVAFENAGFGPRIRRVP
jgi:RNA polymerase sigma factor (sigma-70 family)